MPASDQIESAMAVANSVLAGRFPAALCGFAAGSIIRGEGTTLSDIDIVLVFERLEAAWRESFVVNDFPVEVFVHDPQTLNWFITDDVARGRPSIVHMIAHGRVIGRDTAYATVLQTKAASILSAGPENITRQRLDALRYEITDLLDDLRGRRTSAEMRAIAAGLYQPLADLILLGRGTWTGHGKWIPRLLGALDVRLFHAFDNAFRLLADGKSGAAIAFVQSELDRHGGPLFAGDRREAPANARRASIGEMAKMGHGG